MLLLVFATWVHKAVYNIAVRPVEKTEMAVRYVQNLNEVYFKNLPYRSNVT